MREIHIVERRPLGQEGPGLALRAYTDKDNALAYLGHCVEKAGNSYTYAIISISLDPGVEMPFHVTWELAPNLWTVKPSHQVKPGFTNSSNGGIGIGVTMWTFPNIMALDEESALRRAKTIAIHRIHEGA